MRIERIEVITLRHPWGPPEAGTIRDWPILRVHTDAGLVGISRGGNRTLIETEFAPLLIGEDPRETARHWQRMYDAAWRFRGPGRNAMSSIGALDVALWDLKGKACGEPVWRLLGGLRREVPAYADGIGYNADLDADGVADLASKHAGLGFDAVKFHLVKPNPELALEKVKRSRDVLGPDRKLMIDIHRMWHGRLAAQMAKRFEPYNLYWIEEPVRQDDEVGHLRLVREASSALIAGGEGEGTLYGVRRLIVEGGLQVVQSDILIGGGFTGLMRMAALAEAHQVQIAPHGASFPEINCHLLSAVPNGLMVPACPHTEPYQIWSLLYDPAFKIRGGVVELSDRPGLGLNLNERFLDEYRISHEGGTS